MRSICGHYYNNKWHIFIYIYTFLYNLIYKNIKKYTKIFIRWYLEQYIYTKIYNLDHKLYINLFQFILYFWKEGGGNRNFQNPFLFFFQKKFTNLKIEKLRPHFFIFTFYYLHGIVMIFIYYISVKLCIFMVLKNEKSSVFKFTKFSKIKFLGFFWSFETHQIKLYFF